MAFIQKDEQYYVNKYPNSKLVFGEGQKNAKIFIIGEAPGGDEEKQGRPFVGKAGKNLDEFLKIAGVSRSDVYITNTVKIRPTKISAKTGNYRPAFDVLLQDIRDKKCKTIDVLKLNRLTMRD